jgi:23S rRNA (guanosine2251-2'-O)-methyltransferase
MQTVVILHNIRSVHNVGSIFRTCDAAGVDKLYLCGYTPQPVDRFNRLRKDVAKVALGAQECVDWEYYEDITQLIGVLQKEGFTLIALEQSENSIDYKEVEVGEKNAFILGNEPKGIEQAILKKCDRVAEIPMRGEKESLNVSVAAGIALFQILKI